MYYIYSIHSRNRLSVLVLGRYNFSGQSSVRPIGVAERRIREPSGAYLSFARSTDRRKLSSRQWRALRIKFKSFLINDIAIPHSDRSVHLIGGFSPRVGRFRVRCDQSRREEKTHTTSWFYRRASSPRLNWLAINCDRSCAKPDVFPLVRRTRAGVATPLFKPASGRKKALRGAFRAGECCLRNGSLQVYTGVTEYTRE